MKEANPGAKPTRVGLVGCGFYAQKHRNAWRDLAREGAELVAVCDRDEAKARAVGGGPARTRTWNQTVMSRQL